MKVRMNLPMRLLARGRNPWTQRTEPRLKLLGEHIMLLMDRWAQHTRMLKTLRVLLVQ